MVDIGIVGAGISGLHLALRLQQLGVGTTLYAEQGPDQLRVSRPPNLVGRFEQTRARERALGVSRWDLPGSGLFCIHFTVQADPGLSFCGLLSRPFSAVDFRIYLPHLLEDYECRGGRVVLGSVDSRGVACLAERHDLMVVTAGGRSMAGLFERDPERSPYTAPQRQVCGGMFLGMAYTEPLGLAYHVIPGVGEIFNFPFYSFGGRITGMTFESVPGGPLEVLTQLPYDAGSDEFERTVLDLLARYAPSSRERIDERLFTLTRPIDWMRGTITPVVRRGWAALGEDRYAVAIGDAWVLNDPVAGQGANLGSSCAFVLAEAIVNAARFDEGFCHAVVERMWDIARPVTEWSNAFLQPPPPHAMRLLAAAATDQRVADKLIDNWNDPTAAWAAFASPAGAAAFLRCLGTPGSA
ncbi:MAG: styrene monooxygenase/indole monooxygenase family protein [Pseudonocardiaceae bacterium]